MVMLAIVVHVPVAGSQSSHSYAGLFGTAFGPSVPLVPPVTRTLPSASKVALKSLRPPVTIDPVFVHVGVGLFRSMTSAVSVGETAQPVS